MPARNPLDRADAALRKIAMGFDGVTEAFPWGHRAFKVRGKGFAYLVREGDTLRLSLKLPFSNAAALSLPFAEPTGYGLGKHGWVTSTFGPGDDVPVDLLGSWIEESYRAIAPKPKRPAARKSRNR